MFRLPWGSGGIDGRRWGIGEQVIALRRYSVELRRKMIDLIEAGKPVSESAAQLGTTAQAVGNWQKQVVIERGVRTGTSTSELAELSVTPKRTRELKMSVGSRAQWTSC
jgi:transposase